MNTNPAHFFTSDPPQGQEPRETVTYIPASSPPLPPQVHLPPGTSITREPSWHGLTDALPAIPESSNARSRVPQTQHYQDAEGDTHIRGTANPGQPVSIITESDDPHHNLIALTNIFHPNNAAMITEERGGIQFDPEKVGSAQPSHSTHTIDAWQNAHLTRAANDLPPWHNPFYPD